MSIFLLLVRIFIFINYIYVDIKNYQGLSSDYTKKSFLSRLGQNDINGKISNHNLLIQRIRSSNMLVKVLRQSEKISQFIANTLSIVFTYYIIVMILSQVFTNCAKDYDIVKKIFKNRDTYYKLINKAFKIEKGYNEGYVDSPIEVNDNDNSKSPIIEILGLDVNAGQAGAGLKQPDNHEPGLEHDPNEKKPSTHISFLSSFKTKTPTKINVEVDENVQVGSSQKKGKVSKEKDLNSLKSHIEIELQDASSISQEPSSVLQLKLQDPRNILHDPKIIQEYSRNFDNYSKYPKSQISSNKYPKSINSSNRNINTDFNESNKKQHKIDIEIIDDYKVNLELKKADLDEKVKKHLLRAKEQKDIPLPRTCFNMLCCGNKSQKSLFKDSRAFINYYTDIAIYIQKMHEIDIIKYLLFGKTERKFISILANPESYLRAEILIKKELDIRYEERVIGSKDDEYLEDEEATEILSKTMRRARKSNNSNISNISKKLIKLLNKGTMNVIGSRDHREILINK